MQDKPLFCTRACVPGGVRGLGTAVGNPKRHSCSWHHLAEGGHRKRAVHTCSALQGHHRCLQEEKGDEIGPDVVLPSRNSRLCGRCSAHCTPAFPQRRLCVAPCWSLEMFPEVSSWRWPCWTGPWCVPVQVWLQPEGMTHFSSFIVQTLWLNNSQTFRSPLCSTTLSGLPDQRYCEVECWQTLWISVWR